MQSTCWLQKICEISLELHNNAIIMLVKSLHPPPPRAAPRAGQHRVGPSRRATTPASLPLYLATARVGHRKPRGCKDGGRWAFPSPKVTASKPMAPTRSGAMRWRRGDATEQTWHPPIRLWPPRGVSRPRAAASGGSEAFRAWLHGSSVTTWRWWGGCQIWPSTPVSGLLGAGSRPSSRSRRGVAAWRWCTLGAAGQYREGAMTQCHRCASLTFLHLHLRPALAYHTTIVAPSRAPSCMFPTSGSSCSRAEFLYNFVIFYDF